MKTNWEKEKLKLRKAGIMPIDDLPNIVVSYLKDNIGDIKMQFAVTPVPDQSDGEGPKLAHTAPRRQLVITLDGLLEFKSCDVEKMDQDHQTVISKGQILLADDLEGAGHVWSFLKDKEGVMHPWVRCYVHLGEEYDHFISKLKN